jgi:imidazolonepropionase-like amidohydrolase
MRKFLRPIRLIVVSIAGVLSFAAQGQEAPIDYLIEGVTILDPATGVASRDQDVFVSGSRISAISPAGATSPAIAGRRIDGRGRYLIPGLWDMHVHLLDKSRWSWGSRLAVANGITGFRDPATTRPMPEVQRLRAQIAAGEIIAPRFITSGPLIDGPPAIFSEFVTVAAPDAMRDTVRDLRRQGADFVKVYTRLSRESFLAALEESRNEGLYVSGHVPLVVTTAEASDLGMRSIEHVYRHRMACASAEDEIRSLLLEQSQVDPADDPARYEALEMQTWDLGLRTYDSEKCRALGARLARNGTWFVPTLVEMHSRYRADAFDAEAILRIFQDDRLRFFPPDRVARWRSDWLDQADWLTARPDAAQISARARQEITDRIRMVADLHRGGARLLAGTDASFNFPLVLLGFSLHDELEMLVEAGLSTSQALQTATSNAAEFLGLPQLGSIKVGNTADLVLLEANPLEDIRNTRRIAAVMLAGRYLDRAALDELLDEAAGLAREPGQ